MYILPKEQCESVEYDYAIIDPNLNATFFYDLEPHLISLAPDYARKVEHVFPYLLRFSTVEKSLLEEIFQQDESVVKQGGNAFFCFIFKSVPTREPDIVKHLKSSLVYELDGRKFLYRFFDPKIWMLLNYFKSPDFIYLHHFFKNIKVPFYNQYLEFNNIILKKDTECRSCVDYKLLENIGISNRVLRLIDYSFKNLDEYFNKVINIFKDIYFINERKIIIKHDKIAVVYHMALLGSGYIEKDFFDELSRSEKGYEQASKQIPTLNWEVFFKKNNIFDEDLKNKVMYGY